MLFKMSPTPYFNFSLTLYHFWLQNFQESVKIATLGSSTGKSVSQTATTSAALSAVTIGSSVTAPQASLPILGTVLSQVDSANASTKSTQSILTSSVPNRPPLHGKGSPIATPRQAIPPSVSSLSPLAAGSMLAQPDSGLASLTMEVVRNVVEEAIQDMRVDLRRDIRNMHLELLHLAQIQRVCFYGSKRKMICTREFKLGLSS